MKSSAKFSLLAAAMLIVLMSGVGYFIVRKSRAAGADINGDGVVNITDLSILASNYGQTGMSFAQGDLNGDGDVNIIDLSILAAAWGSIGTNYNSLVVSDSPVAFWSMNNPNGIESDLTGHNNNGTYENGAPALTTMLNGDQAVVFNGSNQYMTVPSNSSMSISTTHQLTWEGWIRPDNLQFLAAPSGYVDWMGKCANYSPTCEWESRMYTSVNSQNRCNRLSAYAFNLGAGLGSGADWQPDCNLLQAGQWLYVVGEYQTLAQPPGCNGPQVGGIDIWVNGVKWNQSDHLQTGCMSQFGITPASSTSPLNIGTMALDSWFQGAIGKVAIYNYLLSQSQINAHYNAMTNAQPTGSCANTCTIPVPTP